MQRIYEELGRRVAGARRDLGFSQERLAAAVGLSRTSIVNLEAGRQRVPIHQLYRIAGALELDPSDLLPPAPTLGEDDRKAEWVTKVTQADGRKE